MLEERCAALTTSERRLAEQVEALTKQLGAAQMDAAAATAAAEASASEAAHASARYGTAIDRLGAANAEVARLVKVRLLSPGPLLSENLARAPVAPLAGIGERERLQGAACRGTGGAGHGRSGPQLHGRHLRGEGGGHHRVAQCH